MKKKMSGFTVSAALFIGTISAAQAQMSISIGDYIQMGTYYEKPVLWRCVDEDENGPLMLSDKILCLKAWDAWGSAGNSSHERGYEGGTWRKTWGSNYWSDSNIHDWLNSNSGRVTWTCGNQPDNGHLKYNSYNNESGFLTNFTDDEINSMLVTEQKSLLDSREYGQSNEDINSHMYNYSINDVVQNYDTAYGEKVNDRVFLPDVNQIYNVYSNLGDYYMAYPTQECVYNSEYKDAYLSTENKWSYWLRSPKSSLSGACVRFVSDNGYIYNSNASGGAIGIRPAFYLNSEYASVQSGSGTEDEPYILCNNSSEQRVTMKYENGNLSIKSPENITAILYIVKHDEEGRILSCVQRTLNIEKGINNIEINDLNIGSNVGLMLWDEKMEPLCNGIKVL